MARSSSRPAVLIFASGFPPGMVGGLEQYAKEIAAGFGRQGYTPVVITQRKGNRGLERVAGLPIINVGKGGQAIVLVKMLIAGYRLKNRRRFRFAHATSWRVAIPVILLRLPRPYSVTIHGREILSTAFPLRWLMRFVFRSVDHIFAVSDYTLKQAVERRIIPPNSGLRNWNGFSPPAQVKDSETLPKARSLELGGCTGKTRLLTVCRLAERKNVHGAILALGLLKRDQRITDFEYIVAGDGEMRDSLERLIVEEDLVNEVRLVGHVGEHEKARLYHNADIFVHCQIAVCGGTDVEGFGLAVVEAMAWGVAVIAGIDGGTRELVLNRSTGVTVDGRELCEIADAIETLANDPRDRERLAKNGRSWVYRNLSWDQHVAFILSVCKVLPSDSLDAEYIANRNAVSH